MRRLKRTCFTWRHCGAVAHAVVLGLVQPDQRVHGLQLELAAAVLQRRLLHVRQQRTAAPEPVCPIISVCLTACLKRTSNARGAACARPAGACTAEASSPMCRPAPTHTRSLEAWLRCAPFWRTVHHEVDQEHLAPQGWQTAAEQHMHQRLFIAACSVTAQSFSGEKQRQMET